MPLEFIPIADLLLAVIIACIAGAIIGGAVYQAGRDFLCWLESRPWAPPSPATLDLIARALRRRANVLEIRAQTLREKGNALKA